MAKKQYNFVHSMKRWELFRLMLAVGLLFGVHGPVFLLANSVLEPGSVALLVVRTLLVISFSALIVLAIRMPLVGVPLAFVGLVAMVSSEQITGFITGKDERVVDSISQTVQITPAEFKLIKEQRLRMYGLTAVLVGLSWAMMASVLNSEGKKRGRLQAEVNIARDIQQSLLPHSSFSNDWCSVSGMAIPTSEVGGDYFDIIGLSKDLVAVVIADVSGHGVGAGIVSAMTKSALHLQLAQDPSPSTVLTKLNGTLASITEDKTFVTCAYILLNDRERTARIATAGHPAVLYKKKGRSDIAEIRIPNFALGIKENVHFREKKIRYTRGDHFFLHTDGIVEAARKQGEQFGLDRLKKIVSAENESSELCSRVLQSVKQFTGSQELDDDVTLVSISLARSPTSIPGLSSTTRSPVSLSPAVST